MSQFLEDVLVCLSPLPLLLLSSSDLSPHLHFLSRKELFASFYFLLLFYTFISKSSDAFARKKHFCTLRLTEWTLTVEFIISEFHYLVTATFVHIFKSLILLSCICSLVPQLHPSFFIRQLPAAVQCK